jgi:hypothetical protein
MIRSAEATVRDDADFETIASLVGVPSTAFIYDRGTKILQAVGVAQNVLDAALSAYDHDAALFEKNKATIADVKAEARRRIETVYPSWKQTNMIARSTELQEKRISGGSLTVSEQAEVVALEAAWAWVKSVRSASDSIEAALPMSVAEMVVDARWPS